MLWESMEIRKVRNMIMTVGHIKRIVRIDCKLEFVGAKHPADGTHVERVRSLDGKRISESRHVAVWV